MRIIVKRAAVRALAWTVWAIAAAPVSGAICAKTSSAAPAMARLREAMEHGRFIAYTPTSLQLITRPTRADPETIHADLKVLRPRFDSLITYGAANGAEAIPAIAASLGFRALIIGLYDPFDAAEMNAAIMAATSHPQLVVGLSLGNEMLFFHRHSYVELEKLLDAIRARIPRTPLSTSEPFHVYYEPAAAPIMERMDFLLPNIHPIFQPWFRSASDSDATQFVVNVVSKLVASYCGPILVKETGVPSEPEAKGYTAARQASFYTELQQRFPSSGGQAFAYFSAFDAPWRVNDVGPAPGQRPQPEEAHWGLYDDRRHPKRVITTIAPLPARSR